MSDNIFYVMFVKNKSGDLVDTHNVMIKLLDKIGVHCVIREEHDIITSEGYNYIRVGSVITDNPSLSLSDLDLHVYTYHSKEDTAKAFASFYNSIKDKLDKIASEANSETEDKECNCDIGYKIVKADNETKSNLAGIMVLIEGKECYIPKDEYDELYKLDEMLSKHGYKISSIVVE